MDWDRLSKVFDRAEEEFHLDEARKRREYEKARQRAEDIERQATRRAEEAIESLPEQLASSLQRRSKYVTAYGYRESYSDLDAEINPAAMAKVKRCLEEQGIPTSEGRGGDERVCDVSLCVEVAELKRALERRKR